MIKFEL